MNEALNPALYSGLRRRYGEVDIVRPGVEMYAKKVRLHATGITRKQILSWGETYQLNCPFCGDRRKRLYVNYLWGVVDTDGKRNLSWIRCFNEDCFHEYDRRLHFADSVAGYGTRYRPAISDLRRGRKQELEPLRAVTFPGQLTPLERLGVGHKARWYLISRYFDPEEIGRQYGVEYCSACYRYPGVAGRLVVPIRFNEELVGWQARFLGSDADLIRPDGTRDVKYFTMPGFKKTQVLYNWDVAKTKPFLVICEGVTDVWAFGPEAVALFGKTISHSQWELIESHPARSIVLLLDSDTVPRPGEKHHIDRAMAEAKARGMHKRILPVWLPSGTDVADFSREYVLSEIKRASCQRQQSRARVKSREQLSSAR